MNRPVNGLINGWGVWLDAIVSALRGAIRAPFPVREHADQPVMRVSEFADAWLMRYSFTAMSGTEELPLVAEIEALDGERHRGTFRLRTADHIPLFDLPVAAVTGWTAAMIDPRPLLGLYGSPESTVEPWGLGDIPHGPALLAAMVSGYVVRRDDAELGDGTFIPSFELTYEGRAYLASLTAARSHLMVRQGVPFEYSTLVDDDGNAVVFEHYTGRIAGGEVILDTGEPAGWVDLLTVPASPAKLKPITEDVAFIGIDGRPGRAASCSVAPSP